MARSPVDMRCVQHIVLYLALFALLATASSLPAQESEDLPTQLWLSYQHQHRISDKVLGFGSLGYEELTSEEEFFGEWTRLYLTAGASYEWKPWLRFAGGLGFYSTYHPDSDNIFESRLWQEAKIFWPESLGWLRRFVLTHRLRLEERFISADKWHLSWRFRYRMDTRIGINTYDVEPGSFYLPLAVEFYADLGGGDREELFAQKGRVTIGIGYVFNSSWTLDFRYHSQRARVRLDESFQANGHVVDLSVRTSVRIRDLIKGR